MKALFIVWSITGIIYLIISVPMISLMTYTLIKNIQTKLHNWANK